MTPPLRVVFDCNVLFQALISQRGPAWAAFDAAYEKRVALVLSQYIVDELRDVVARPHLAARFALTDDKIAAFLATLEGFAEKIVEVPHVFDFPRDPNDAHYVDLAVTANASLIVSRDADLLSLSDLATSDGREFAAKFPAIEILTPPQLLSRLAPPAAT